MTALKTILLALAAGVACAQEPAPIKPLDAALSGFSYPHEVKFLDFTDQGQPLKMAYMDVAAETPNGKSVLLLHGKNFSGAYWDKTISALVKDGYRVIVPDQIGFGKSSKPTAYQYSFHAFADRTKALLDGLKVGKVAVVGHSMGGMVATRFALMYPETAEKLVLVNPIGLEDWKRKVPYRTIDQNTAAEAKKRADDVRGYMTKAYFDGKWKDEYEPLIALQAGWLAGPDKVTIARVSALTSDMVITQPVLYEFPDLELPTLLIIGDRDRTAIGKDAASPEVAATLGLYQNLGREAAAAIPGAKLVEMKGLGHLPQFEDFDGYWKALGGFLRE
ncbi:MAG: alpha/beta hydrolase [Verrucomicrobiaceae bacterium]|nr:MAG: alpha/beta hydrolase [Verrucomicrobiaceae bacterium]